ncbi:Ig-like domain-containing protein [Methanobacterium spitsbergense]|uniref:Zinc-ribbon domain-containing protein n=1 Tax=Methanobacterium spitsbergense TaxID=2874285 RepID=A0A8T5V443_9EURY|nr:Ig-like domain-containing protein [Methanobacterium spitsbergense]MBZ2166641.1 hypothetical protein [Methanobacterium spitsbergense]
MGYLVCEKCGGYYELQQGESPDDFELKCDCGGKLNHVENLGSIGNNKKKMEKTVTCPKCGTENPENARLCKSCKKLLRIPPKPPISNKNQESKEGILKTWNEQSNGIKVASILGVCCLGLILIAGITGMFTPDKTTTNLPTTTNQATTPQSTTPTSSSSSQVEISVSYSGPWTGAIADSTGTRSVEGTGPQKFPLGENPGIVSTNFQKHDNGTGTLTVQILDGGNPVETQSTSAEFGVASVTHSF